MKKIFAIAILLLLAITLNAGRSLAQTPGNLSFSVTTTEPAGNYNNAFVLAMWITDTNNVFVKTKTRYAATRIQYLTYWISHSSYNVVDAVTGATRTSHGTFTFNWNGTDVAGNVVTDKPYRIWIQMSDANTPGQYTYVTFTKDTAAQSFNPSNYMNLTNMSVNWNSTIGIDEAAGAKLQFACTPNPVSDQARISYTLPAAADVTVTLHDLSGRNLGVLSDGNQTAGSHSLSWNTAGLAAGVYMLRINTGGAVSSCKVLVE